MSARPVATQPTWSIARTVSTAHVPTSQYVDFFMASIWEWTPAGVLRVNRFLDSLNVDRPTYSFDKYLNTWQVRCPKKSESYIRRNFVKLLAEIEEEYEGALNEKALQLVQEDGTLPDDSLHRDVMLPIQLPKTPRLPRDQGVQQSNTNGGSGDGGGSAHSVPHAMLLVIPDELRNAQNIVVWQDLQAKHKDFEGTAFMSPVARAAIESAYKVQLVSDPAQKVIFVGNAPSLDDAHQVKQKLTNLLQEYYLSRRLPQIAHHIFFVKSAHPYTIDTREITLLNPNLARSTILDPWRYSVPQQYEVFENYAGIRDAGVVVLRVCLFSPLKNGILNKYWSLFGPLAPNVFGGRRPTRSSRYFEGLKAPRRSRALQIPADAGPVSNWLEELSIAPAAIDAATLPDVGIAGTGTPVQGHGEDDPVPLNFDPSKRNAVAFQARAPFPLPDGSESVRVKPQPVSLLDQQDAVLRDRCSTMQRAMKPSQRRISVPDPELVQSIATQPSLDDSRPINSGATACSSDQEFNIFVMSIGQLLNRMRRRCGVVSLRAELGRYYAYNIPVSARAMNAETEPANGWFPTDLRGRIEEHSQFLFTKALSSWGNDADFLAAGNWHPKSTAVFFDFRFQAMVGPTPVDVVLEVDACDYTWKLRFLENTSNVVFVHCLAQHWDYQVSLKCDHVLELRYHWGKFAEALIESLDVKPPEIEFQHTFEGAPVTDKASPIIIKDVRARQVCRFIHQNQKTYLDISRIMPTKVTPNRNPKYRTVRGVLARGSAENPCGGDNQQTGEFAQWFEASVSSVRLEELFKQNEELVPGDDVGWTVQQLEQENLLADLYFQAAEMVGAMDGIGVECHNGHEQRRQKTDPEYMW